MDYMVTQMDEHLFSKGVHYEIYEKMGAHIVSDGDAKGTYFAVWAPHAKGVSVVGDFNSWDLNADPMELLPDSGIYHLFVPDVLTGSLYKYAVQTQSGEILYKADPYAGRSQYRPETASIVADISDYCWADEKWQKRKKICHTYKEAMSVYEVHLGSWKKSGDGGFRGYRELAAELAEYVNYMGYTHVELMGIAEHPFDGSWGYQVTGYYAPTARYGTPEDFMYFIDYMHQAGIGVILDWVPAHFPKDAHGLAKFDGEALYEHHDPMKGEHPHWGTNVFNYEKAQVVNFLLANALYWVEKFHIDGLRVDAVASMLYLDYGREDGQWVPNRDGSNKNHHTIEFFKHLNSIMAKRNPGTLMIAEESTAFANVSKSVENDNGLGFTYKWNMGWMHDFTEYMKKDSFYRQYHHNQLTFSFSYAYSENYILPLSHDEVVHLKCSMVNKMPGEIKDKFANLRVAYGLMFAHPGKKLLFMGQDFAQLREWSEERSLDWYLLDNEREHRQINDYMRALLHMYRDYPALYQLDCEPEGYEWINGADAENNMLTFCRISKNKRKCLLFHFNFSPVIHRDFRVGALCPGEYKVIFSSDSAEYGGQAIGNKDIITAEDVPWHWKDYSLQLNVAAFSMTVCQFDYVKPSKKAKVKKHKLKVRKVT